MTRTTIGIIGAGNMGRAFAKRLSAAGYDVSISAKDPAHAAQAASDAGSSVRAVPVGEVARGADLIILATYFHDAPDALRAAGDLTGKTIVDIINPLTPDMARLSVGYTTSAAEELQKVVPTAQVVKAFNTIFAQLLGSDAHAQVLYAGDDAEAKLAVRTVIERAGFEAVDAGPLAAARNLEPLGLLNIYLGYVAGRGTGISPAFVGAA